jgi:hypothetical protein
MGTVQLRTLSLAAVLCLCASTAHAQQKGAKDSLSTRSAVKRGAGQDANIKRDEAVNSKTAAAVKAPAAKGGAKTRGATAGQLHVDNRTGWYIRIYVDGDYNGMVGPFGDVIGYYGCDNYRLYAVARFNDGSTRTWGPTLVNTCDDFTWRLWE